MEDELLGEASIEWCLDLKLLQFVTLHGKTVNKVIARARHGPNTFARYLSNTLSVRICKKKQKK